MVCGNAVGELLPPAVYYKAKYCYPSWGEGGPKGARYSSTPHGWVDMASFSEYFHQMFLPRALKQPGKKILVCDNLAAHFSLDVLKTCKDNDIHFVCFPPNSTHLLQPLDVGFFSTMKAKWRKQLTAYSEQDPDAKFLQKTIFPRYRYRYLYFKEKSYYNFVLNFLNKIRPSTGTGYRSNILPCCHLFRMLKELWEVLKPLDCLPNAFAKCGLVPLNRQKVLERLPSVASSEEIATAVDQLLLKKLEVN